MYDIGPLDASIPDVRFQQWNTAADDRSGSGEMADSVSCRHAPEHVGRRRVECNAHRIFDPRDVRELALNLGLVLGEFPVISGSSQRLVVADAEWDGIAREPYLLEICQFNRSPAS